MPPYSDWADAQQVREGRDAHAFELVQDDHGPTARRQHVEGPPDRGPCDEGGLLVLVDIGRPTRFSVVALANSLFAPLIAADIDEHTDEPGFLIGQPEWHGPW